MNFKSINPHNGEVIASYTGHTKAETDEILKRSHQAFLSWRQIPIEDRSRLLKNAAGLLRENNEGNPLANQDLR